MQRLALAIILVVALLGLLASLGVAFRKVAGGPGMREEATPMQRAAYFVLLALIVYVSVMGARA